MNGSSIRFSQEWRALPQPDGTTIDRPMLLVAVRGAGGWTQTAFLVDSGADTSMAPFELFELLDRRWRQGERFPVRGIARRRDCALIGRIHDVDLLLRAAGVFMRVPIVFVRGDGPYVLGRDVLFEAFRITFEPTRRRTVFELADR